MAQDAASALRMTSTQAVNNWQQAPASYSGQVSLVFILVCDAQLYFFRCEGVDIACIVPKIISTMSCFMKYVASYEI
jgi:hypothetical protein